MKLRRIISLVLLVVYFTGTAGAAIASMSCHCARMQAHAAHLCCHHCAEHANDSEQTFRAPCCSNTHSTEVKLYTASSSDDDLSVKSPCIDLPATLADQLTITPESRPCSDKIAERRAPFVSKAHRLPSGLRAPPVLA